MYKGRVRTGVPRHTKCRRTPFSCGLDPSLAFICAFANTLMTDENESPRMISIDRMDERHRALIQPVAGTYEAAASVCLSRHHSSPVRIAMSDNGLESSAGITWTPPDSRTEDAFANTIDTTEQGAYCCVIAGVELLRGRYAVRRAETGTGADYYVGTSGAGEADLENCLRLEVSGVAAGQRHEVAKRLLEKVQQAQRGDSSLPALAGVIGFAAKLLMLQDVPEEL